MNLAYSDPVSNEVKLVAKWKLPYLYAYSKVWNLIRRPLVKKWQADIVRLASQIRADLQRHLLPELYDNMRQGCSSCRDLYGFLRGQPFTSQIEQALRTHYCHTHFQAYQTFYIMHESWFKESHNLSDKVCGFKSKLK